MASLTWGRLFVALTIVSLATAVGYWVKDGANDQPGWANGDVPLLREEVDEREQRKDHAHAGEVRDAGVQERRAVVEGDVLPDVPAEAPREPEPASVEADDVADVSNTPEPATRLSPMPVAGATEFVAANVASTDSIREQNGAAFVATHYGVSYQGSPLGCGGGVYDTNDPSIVAVGPAYYAAWPCGTRLRVCGSAGCIDARRRDSCPGCADSWVDLSEAGILATCGHFGRCSVTVEVLK